MSLERSVERERKFLVRSLPPLDGHSPRRVEQVYLALSEAAELRLRYSGSTFTLGVKGTENLVTRPEYEYVLPDAELGLSLLLSSELRVVKERYDLVVGEHVWNVDVFLEANKGLVIAEVEFEPDDAILIPSWASTEVTGDTRYYNRSLAQNPYSYWTG